eukprot:4501991-Amphidinium_carterae.1
MCPKTITLSRKGFTYHREDVGPLERDIWARLLCTVRKASKAVLVRQFVLIVKTSTCTKIGFADFTTVLVLSLFACA